MSTTTDAHAAVTAAVPAIESERAAQLGEPAAYKCRQDARATPKQVYRLAREAFDLLGVAWPQSRQDASELIGQLAEANKARRQNAGESSSGDPMAF